MPLALLLFALAAAGTMAYGTSPTWGNWGAQGIAVILWSRRLQWPLIAVSLLLSLGVIALVAGGRRRVWWLIGLFPVLALFAHRFVTGPHAKSVVAENPPLVSAGHAGFIQPGDHVVGFIWNQTPYAMPYAALFQTPVVVLTDRSGPLVVIWSAYANRALVVPGARDVMARDLEAVSSPVDALMVYNTRLGEFINGVTGLTTTGATPAGFGTPLQTWKMTWEDWRLRYPSTQVMAPYEATLSRAPTEPVEPVYPIPKSGGQTDGQIQGQTQGPTSGTRRVCVVATTQPIAIPSEAITDRPLNLTAGETPLLIVRVGGVVKAFQRQVQGDLRPRFYPTTRPGKPKVAWSDTDTAAGWDVRGEVVEGPPAVAGVKLVPVRVEEDLDWAVEKFWIPSLILESPQDLAAAVAEPEPKPVPDRPPPKKNRKPKATAKKPV
jgi:hypothetical protein